MLASTGWLVADHSLFTKVSGQASLHAVDLDANIGFLPKDSPGYNGGRAGDATNYTVRATRNFPLGVGDLHVSVALARSSSRPVAGVLERGAVTRGCDPIRPTEGA